MEHPSREKLPPDAAPPAEWLAFAEKQVGTRFQTELSGFLDLGGDTTDFALRLIERIERSSQDDRALHARTLILARIVSDLQGCLHLIRHGYAAQAMTLVGSMLEMAHTGSYIGADLERAAKFFAWDDPRVSFPGRIKDTIRQVAKAADVTEEAASREYDTIYRNICLIKHGNPMAMGNSNMALRGETAYYLAGPIWSDEFLRLGYVAIQWAVRYALLAVTGFVEDLISGQEQAAFMAELRFLRDRNRTLILDSKRQLGDAAPPTSDLSGPDASSI